MDSSLESLLSLRINAGNLPERSIPSVLALQQFIRANPGEAIDWSVVQETARSLSGRLLSVKEIVDRIFDAGIELDADSLDFLSLDEEPPSPSEWEPSASENQYFDSVKRIRLFVKNCRRKKVSRRDPGFSWIDADSLPPKEKAVLLSFREYVARHPGKWINYAEVRRILLESHGISMGTTPLKRKLKQAGVPIHLLPVHKRERSSKEIQVKPSGRPEKPNELDLTFPRIDIKSLSSPRAVMALRALRKYVQQHPGKPIIFSSLAQILHSDLGHFPSPTSIRSWLRQAGVPVHSLPVRGSNRSPEAREYYVRKKNLPPWEERAKGVDLLFSHIDADSLSEKPRLALLSLRSCVQANPGKDIRYKDILEVMRSHCSVSHPLLKRWLREAGVDFDFAISVQEAVLRSQDRASKQSKSST